MSPPADQSSAPDAIVAAAGVRVMALHRWIVRLTIDPALVDAVHSGAPIEGLQDEDRALLRAVDPRAWGVDVHRRARFVTTVLEECPVIGALLGPEAIDGWIGGPGFAAALAPGGSLCLAAAEALAPAAGPLGELERRLCAARRPAPPVGRGISLNSGVDAFFAPAGTLDAFAAARARLGPAPLRTLIEDGLRLRAPAVGPGEEALLISADDRGQPGVSHGSPALVRLLDASRSPAPRAAVLSRARKLGAGSGAAELIDALLGEGLLCAR
jgi:hypothetical protein